MSHAERIADPNAVFIRQQVERFMASYGFEDDLQFHLRDASGKYKAESLKAALVNGIENLVKSLASGEVNGFLPATYLNNVVGSVAPRKQVEAYSKLYAIAQQATRELQSQRTF